jgi:hypothetical protein
MSADARKPEFSILVYRDGRHYSTREFTQEAAARKAFEGSVVFCKNLSGYWYVERYNGQSLIEAWTSSDE